MMYRNSIFSSKVPDKTALVAYGFKRDEACFVYNTLLQKGFFNLTVRILDKKEIDIRVVENSTGEEYEPVYVKNASGKFVGKVRAELDAVLTDISEKCFVFSPFQTDYTLKVIKYIRDKYGDKPEFLWEKFPRNAVFRDKGSEKWYAAILTVKNRNVGLEGDEICEVIDLKGKPDKLAELVDGKKYLRGYHMNKKHWYTIRLDGSVDIKEIYKHIDSSYSLVKNGI